MRINNLRYKGADSYWADFKKHPRVSQLISRGQYLISKDSPEVKLKLMSTAVPIDRKTFPVIYKIYRDCCAKLKFQKNVKLYFVATNDGLASSFISENIPHISLDSSLINASKEMLSFVFGHELAHIKLGHCNKAISDGQLSDLPESVARLWYSMSRCWEISADRLASTCCNTPSAAESAIVSLSFKNLIIPSNLDGIVESITTLKHLIGNNPWLKLGETTHPHMAIRLVSIRKFQSNCFKGGVPVSNMKLALEQTDKYVDELMSLYSPSEKSVEHSLFIYSVFLLAVKHQKLSNLSQTPFEKYANRSEIRRLRSQIKRKGNKTEFLLAKIRESSGEIAKIQEHIRIMWLMRVNETLNETGVISFSEEEFMTLSKVWEIKVDLVADCFN